MPDKMPLGLRFSLLDRAFKRKLDERLRELELTGVQFGVLGRLAQLEAAGQGEINQRALESASHVTHPTMTEILRRLEQKGFIICQPSRSDRRSKSISSTEKARCLHREVDRIDEEVTNWLCAGLSPEQIEQMEAITARMLTNALEIYRKGCGKSCDQDPC